MGANEWQVGGEHYKTGGEEHWDRVARLGLDYFQGQITKYVERWKKKNGVEDLKKARHFLDKYIELNEMDGNCITRADGACIGGLQAGKNPCMHDDLRGRVKPTGWEGYEYEGGTADGDFYRCKDKDCRERFWIPIGADPNRHHDCGSVCVEATSAYVNQDGPVGGTPGTTGHA